MSTAFKMFDPYAFLGAGKAETCQQAEGSGALATLAGLAAEQETARISPPRAFENRRPLAAEQPGDARSRLAKLAGLAGEGLATDDAKSRAHGSDAAKPAQVAKIDAPGKAVRSWADGIAQLDAERPPHDVPAPHWRHFIYDAARFIDNGFAEQAAALGWDDYDLFGCDRNRPFARLDQAGLVWLLHGDRLIALSENVATIQTRSGARQTWRRRPRQPGRVLAWQLP